MTDFSDKDVDRNSRTDALPALKRRRAGRRSHDDRGPDLNELEHQLEALIDSANSLTERLAEVSDRLNRLSADEERAAEDCGTGGRSADAE